MTVSPAQVKEARQLLGWSRERLAGESGVHTRTILNLEGGKGRPLARIIHTIQSTLEAAGVQFTNGEEPGVVKLRKGVAKDDQPRAAQGGAPASRLVSK